LLELLCAAAYLAERIFDWSLKELISGMFRLSLGFEPLFMTRRGFLADISATSA